MSHQKEPHTPGGIRLRALRESSRQTQLAVELEASLGIGYLQRLELGKVQQPERETLGRILAALGASFMEQREVLELFGYTVGSARPTETETQWAITVFQSEVKHDTVPAYLLDCSHRLLAWNALVPKLFGELRTGTNDILMPRLIFDSKAGIALAVVNAETFFSAQLRILQYERRRWGDDSWYGPFVNEMRQYQVFDQYWVKQNSVGHVQAPMRPAAQLQLDTGRGLAHFRLISEPFVQDPRFRVIYYLPADANTIRQCLDWQN